MQVKLNWKVLAVIAALVLGLVYMGQAGLAGAVVEWFTDLGQ